MIFLCVLDEFVTEKYTIEDCSRRVRMTKTDDITVTDASIC